LLHDSDPFAFLLGLERLGMKFGLENMSRLCDALGRPERRFTSIIVAGTNGKGSVTAMLDAALRAAGHRAARYISPHLERVEERFVIEGHEVGHDALAGSIDRVREAVNRIQRSHGTETLPTFFEATTAVAFDLFARARIDVAVLEVGLGGRLDATNVVSPIAAAITSIDFDHQALLGGTLAEIAREKAGVIKPGIPVVCGPLPEEALREIAAVCEQQGATLIRSDREVSTVSRISGDRTEADFDTPAGALERVTLALRGRHQVANAAVAIRLLQELDARGVAVSADAIRAGLDATDWPGRLELLRRGGTEILLDAAHNPAGAQSLADYLVEAGWSGATLVFGALKDKDVDGILSRLAPVCGRVICTTPDSPRAMHATEAARTAARYFPARAVEVAADLHDALRRARAASRRVVAAGSIFLIGPLRGILR
jgi:dihydrofolate synthase/folylpolyglutamate synthase